jgi:imidazolonepropionase-like amidohydrolase
MKLQRLLVASLLVASFARADAPGVYAITNATVHPVSGPDIDGGTVLIRDGLIEAVGAGIAIPADATVIDAAGQHVYPGLFDAQTALGLISPTPERGREREGERERRPPEPDAAWAAAEHLNLTDSDLDARRFVGVTTVVAAPRIGIFNGQSVVVNLGEGNAASRIIRSPAAFQVSYNTRSAGAYPGSLMGVIAYIRQTFLDAQQYAAARQVYLKNPAGLRRPDTSPALEALAPALRREVPVVFVADSEAVIRRSRALAAEANVRPIISGGRQAYRLAAELKDVPVLVSVDWPKPPTRREDREEQPLRVIRDRQLAPTTPAVLAKNGVQFALVSGTAKASDFLSGIRKAITNGLSAADALRAVTLAPARIFGVDRQLGSLERGKIANVTVTDRPIFDTGAKVKRLFIDGREIRPQEATERTTESPVNGTWNLSVQTPQGNVAIIVTLKAEAGHVSGTFSGDRGSGEISGGFFDRPTLQFSISVQTEAETSDWVFRGTISDDSIEGTVATNVGTFPFTGSRSR